MKLLREYPHTKALIFDLDGLMIDSEPFWQQADALFFQRYGKKHTPEINKKIMGMGQREIIAYFKEQYGFTGSIPDLVRERREIVYSLLLPNLSLMNGVKDFLNQVYSKFPLAIATSGHSFDGIQEILQRVGIQHLFSICVSGDEVEHSKPAPDIYITAAKKLYVDPSECIVFEDAINGVKAAKSAGMIVVGVNKNEDLYKKLQETGADVVAHNLVEISL